MFNKAIMTINAAVTFILLITVATCVPDINQTKPHIRGGLIKVCFNDTHGLQTVGVV